MHKEEFIDYNKFYTKEEFEQFLTKKGSDNSKFNITLFQQNMEIIIQELALVQVLFYLQEVHLQIFLILYFLLVKMEIAMRKF